jgi:hypothetical protein
MAATSISDLVIQEKEMDLVVGTHGRGIYKMSILPIQQAFKKGVPEADVLFETPVARRPWINDTHREPKYSTLERVPITFYLMKEAEIEIRVNDDKGKTVWTKKLMGKQGFNQFRWDLVTKKVKSMRPYFIHYNNFALPGIYEIQVVGEGINLKGELTIVERKSKE